MYERLLNKQIVPTVAEMTEHCAENAELFSMINAWLIKTHDTEQKMVFPYGNKYGWGIGHYKKKELICNIFAEKSAFTVMIRLTNAQCNAIYDDVNQYTKEHINNKYPCGDGGWVHYRVLYQEHLEDIIKLLDVKCT